MPPEKKTPAQKAIEFVKDAVASAAIIVCCPCLCCYFIYSPPVLCGNAKRRKRESRPNLEPPGWTWESKPPRPIRQSRRSLSSPCGLKAIYPGLKAQNKSKLFTQLTPEIRLQIYEEVLAPEGNEVLHIASTHRRVFGIRCSNTDERNIRGWQHKCWPSMVAFRDGTVQRENKKWEWHRRPGSITGLLRSCRAVYSEAIGILYTKNVLQVRQARTIVEFPLVMPHHRLATIRKLHLDTRLSPNEDIEHWSTNKWNGALQVVKTYMQGLQHFRVSFGVTHEGAAVHDEELVALIRNLSYVKHVRDFVIEFHWWREVDELLVRVGRPPEGFPFRVEVHDILDQPRRPW